MIEELDKKIEAIKEVLSTMPKNNKKNKLKYSEYLETITKEYQELETSYQEEIKKRQQNLLKLKKDISFDKDSLKSKEQYLKDLKTLNYYNTPYEKLNLDYLIHEISHFYKDNFDSLNNDIATVIATFKEVGITLTAKDFYYSPYVYQYMQMFLDSYTKNNLQSHTLKECFEQVYWKCPNIIFHIEFNLKYLYLKNELTIKKYYQNLVNKELNNKNWLSTLKEYQAIIEEELNNQLKNDGYLIDLFLTKKENIKDYSKDKVIKYYSAISPEVVDIISIKKLYYSLIEYQNYLSFAFLIEDVKKLYLEKDKHKNTYKEQRKTLKKLEGKIIKMTKKALRPSRFGKDKKELLSLKINNEIEKVGEIYKELELNKFSEKVASLTDDTTYYDILNLVSSYYLYLRECLKQEFPDILDKEITNKHNELKAFLLDKNITMMNSFTINESFDIPLIISDRYKLLNLNISKEEIENNLSGIIDTLHKIIISYQITSSKLTYEDLLFLSNLKERDFN